MKTELIFTIVVFFGLMFDKLNIFLFCILSSIFHEIFHIITYIVLTGKKPCIKASIFGFALKSDINQVRKKVLIILSGPLFNILAAFLSFIYLQKRFTLNVYVFMLVNVVIGAVNLMPLYYLDGGRLYDAIFKNYYKYEKYLSIISLALFVICILFFTQNKLYSLGAIIIFIIYFIINIKKAI